jgi:hypothetical protein
MYRGLRVRFEKVRIVPILLARQFEKTDRVEGWVSGLTWFIDRH